MLNLKRMAKTAEDIFPHSSLELQQQRMVANGFI